MTWRVAIVVTIMSVLLPATMAGLGWLLLARRDRSPTVDAQATMEIPAGMLVDRCVCLDGGRPDRSGAPPARCWRCGGVRPGAGVVDVTH